ncbi:hypothetical protein AVEN_231311-1 [Araneus ventricosus]|uniref:DUF4817 domain-containing protein n=1 Tax=Araneus ventricosus TaxID=182803 RepID=A0A4Y2CI32_ARAVE|nr:hypothetical protein AVEN_231311-1 [Araneus ventricosus]
MWGPRSPQFPRDQTPNELAESEKRRSRDVVKTTLYYITRRGLKGPCRVDRWVTAQYHWAKTLQELFWDGIRLFESRSDEEDDTPELAPTLQSLLTTLVRGRLTPTYELACNMPHTRQALNGLGIEPGTLRPWTSRPCH